MSILILGLVIFFAIHLLPVTPLKDPLYNWKGESGYKGVISVISLIGFVLIVIGHHPGNADNLWTPPSWGIGAAMIVMPIALILFVASNLKSNIGRVIPHPQLTAVLLWAAVHLINNGDTASALIFISFGVYSLVNMLTTNKPKKSTERQPISRDIASIAIGVGLFVLAVRFHQYLSGIPIM